MITSNRTRELHDALKRRCLYHWIDYPDFQTEYEIVRLKVPGASEQLSYQVVAAVQALRTAELFKPPGVAETLDWATALTIMDTQELDEQIIGDTLGVLLKYQDDVQRVQSELLQELARRALPTVADRGLFLPNLLHFGRLLRQLGVRISTREIYDLADALTTIDLARQDDFYHTLRAFLVHSPDEIELFDRAFDLFWRGRIELALELGLGYVRAAEQETLDELEQSEQRVLRGAGDSDPGDGDAEEDVRQNRRNRHVQRRRGARKRFEDFSGGVRDGPPGDPQPGLANR